MPAIAKEIEMGETCEWVTDDEGVWDTECGNRFEIIDGTPRENQLHWCPYCGKSLQEVRKDAEA